jgi:hypothetical protein
MIPVLLSNALWLGIMIAYCLLFFWQARRDRGKSYYED